MKVFLLSVGTDECVVAAKSQRAAVEALNACARNWSLHAFRDYASTLELDHPIALVALEAPGSVFCRPNDRHGREWKLDPPR